MIKKLLLFIFGFIACHAFSQDEDCDFSDGNYYLQVLIVTDEIPSVDYDKDDFIAHLETNSSISEADSQFLNEHLVDVYRQYPNSTGDPGQKYVYVVSDDETVETLFNTYTESVNAIYLYCDCEFEDGYSYYYARLITDDLPGDDFNKTDFINHIISNSTPSTSQLDFLNDRIVEVVNAFPSAQSESLQKTVKVISDYDIFVPFLYDFPSSFSLVELICDNATLSTNESTNTINDITIFPNPVVRNSTIHIDNQFVEELFIYDVTGKLLDTRVVKGLSTIAMNAFDLKSGVYFLKFTSKEGHITKKVIVK
mgnify:CR=1 FL=1